MNQDDPIDCFNIILNDCNARSLIAEEEHASLRATITSRARARGVDVTSSFVRHDLIREMTQRIQLSG